MELEAHGFSTGLGCDFISLSRFLSLLDFPTENTARGSKSQARTLSSSGAGGSEENGEPSTSAHCVPSVNHNDDDDEDGEEEEEEDDGRGNIPFECSELLFQMIRVAGARRR